MILNDEQILELCSRNHMITPYESKLVRFNEERRVVSYGVSSFGYDIRIGNQFKYLPDAQSPDSELFLDPLAVPHSGVWATAYLDDDEAFIIPPHGLALGHSVERFEIPEDVIAICLGKSTYARLGLIVNVTPLEPGWKGYLTIELTNTSNWPMAVHVNQGIAQLLFFKGEAPSVSYADRAGKYQNQNREVVLSRA
jgi:dCTP deaminase